MNGRRFSRQLLTARVFALAVIAAASCGAGVASTVTPAEAGVHIGSSIRLKSLSDKHHTTRIAYARRAAPIRRGPHRGSKTLTHLDILTPSGQALPYVGLTKLVRTPGSDWTEIRIPGWPNGRHGWVRASALGPFRTVHGRLVVNRNR